MKRRTVLRRAGGLALAGPFRAGAGLATGKAVGAAAGLAAGLGAPVAHGARLPIVLWHTPEGARALRESAVGFTRETGV
ncbi:MAG: hypothetical protein ACKPCJ_07870, partial [Betaproteobacteria bacterium]